MTTLINIPGIMLGAAALVYLNAQRPVTKALVASQVIKGCQSADCPPDGVQILIDRPINTLYLDERGATSLDGIRQQSKARFYSEAVRSPGVRGVVALRG